MHSLFVLSQVRTPGEGGAPDQCACGLFAFDAGEGLLPLWILGDPFLRWVVLLCLCTDVV